MELLLTDQVVVFKIPDCPNCVKARKLLDNMGQPYTLYDLTKIDYDFDSVMDFLQNSAKTRTFPMVFANGRYVGGWKEIEQLDKVGVLDQILNYRI